MHETSWWAAVAGVGVQPLHTGLHEALHEDFTRCMGTLRGRATGSFTNPRAAALHWLCTRLCTSVAVGLRTRGCRRGFARGFV